MHRWMAYLSIERTTVRPLSSFLATQAHVCVCLCLCAYVRACVCVHALYVPRPLPRGRGNPAHTHCIRQRDSHLFTALSPEVINHGL